MWPDNCVAAGQQCLTQMQLILAIDLITHMLFLDFYVLSGSFRLPTLPAAQCLLLDMHVIPVFLLPLQIPHLFHFSVANPKVFSGSLRWCFSIKSIFNMSGQGFKILSILFWQSC